MQTPQTPLDQFGDPITLIPGRQCEGSTGGIRCDFSQFAIKCTYCPGYYCTYHWMHVRHHLRGESPFSDTTSTRQNQGNDRDKQSSNERLT